MLGGNYASDEEKLHDVSSIASGGEVNAVTFMKCFEYEDVGDEHDDSESIGLFMISLRSDPDCWGECMP